MYVVKYISDQHWKLGRGDTGEGAHLQCIFACL